MSCNNFTPTPIYKINPNPLVLFHDNDEISINDFDYCPESSTLKIRIPDNDLCHLFKQVVINHNLSILKQHFCNLKGTRKYRKRQTSKLKERFNITGWELTFRDINKARKSKPTPFILIGKKISVSGHIGEIVNIGLPELGKSYDNLEYSNIEIKTKFNN